MITNSTFTLRLKFGLSFRFFSDIRAYFPPIWQNGAFLHIIILNTNKIQEKICAEILYKPVFNSYKIVGLIFFKF